jgi:hypothetical protein
VEEVAEATLVVVVELEATAHQFLENLLVAADLQNPHLF